MASGGGSLLRNASALRSARWAVVLRVAQSLVSAGRMITRARNRLSKGEQQRFLALLRKSSGRPANLARHEREELRNLLGKALGF